MLDYETPVDFCVEHDISIEAFFFAFLLYQDKRELMGLPLMQHRPKVRGEKGRPLAQVYRYHELVRPWANEDIKRLIDKGFLTEMPPKEEIEHRRMGGSPRYFPDYMEVTPKFADAVMATYTRFMEFWDAYPPTMMLANGERASLRAVDRDEVEKLYYRRVLTRAEHERLMEALEWA
jgi:hypothetical protein